MSHSTSPAAVSQNDVKLAVLRARAHNWLVPMIAACHFEGAMDSERLGMLNWVPIESTSDQLPFGAVVFHCPSIRLRPNVVELSRINNRKAVRCGILRGWRGMTTLTVPRQNGFTSELCHPVLIIVPGSLGGPLMVFDLYIGDPNTPPTAVQEVAANRARLSNIRTVQSPDRVDVSIDPGFEIARLDARLDTAA